MIYNVAHLIRTQFSTLKVYVNARTREGVEETEPDRCLLLTDTGGNEKPASRYDVLTFQVVARDRELHEARKLAWDIFVFLSPHFGLILPSTVVDSVTYPQVVTAQLSAIQTPYCLGADEDGRTEFSNNYTVIMER